MADQAEPTTDPWSNEGVFLRRPWPVFAAMGAGLAYALIWIATGRAELYVARWAFWLLPIIGVISAAIGPPSRRLSRFAIWAMADFVGQATATIVIVVVDALDGDGSTAPNWARFAVAVVSLVFFGVGSLLAAMAHRPERRLPAEMLRQIPPPAATQFQPRAVDVVLDDGSVRSVRVIEGGYVAARPALAVDRIVAIADRPEGPTVASRVGAPASPPGTVPSADAAVVTVVIKHPELRAVVGTPRVLASGATIGEVLADLPLRHPDAAPTLGPDVLLGPALAVYLGDPNRARVPDQYALDLDRPVSDGDTLTVEQKTTV